MMQRTVTIFGSSRPREGEPEYEEARTLGRLLAEQNFKICNGGYGGTMEAAARGAKEWNPSALTIGVVLDPGFGGAKANAYTTQIIVAHSLLGRLETLIRLGDAYVVLKGGTGTLVELSTVWEYMNKHIMEQKPFFVLGSFWRPVIHVMREELIYEGRIRAAKLPVEVQTPEEIVKDLLKFFYKPDPPQADRSALH